MGCERPLTTQSGLMHRTRLYPICALCCYSSFDFRLANDCEIVPDLQVLAQARAEERFDVARVAT